MVYTPARLCKNGFIIVTIPTSVVLSYQLEYSNNWSCYKGRKLDLVQIGSVSYTQPNGMHVSLKDPFMWTATMYSQNYIFCRLSKFPAPTCICMAVWVVCNCSSYTSIKPWYISDCPSLVMHVNVISWLYVGKASSKFPQDFCSSC